MRLPPGAPKTWMMEERPMQWLHKLRISTKIYLLVGLLGVVAGLLGSAGIVAMRTYDTQVEAMTAASSRALLGERVNGLVNAIVMDSRGVYMAENKERVEQFGKPLLENLKRMDALLTQWRPLVPASQMEQFQRAEQPRPSSSRSARSWSNLDGRKAPPLPAHGATTKRTAPTGRH